jgi:hypothetical protein
MSIHASILPHPIVRDDKMQKEDHEKYAAGVSAAIKSS